MGIYCFSIIELLWSVLTGLNKGAFYDCTGLKTLTINSESFIKYPYAFSGCALTDIQLKSYQNWRVGTASSYSIFWEQTVDLVDNSTAVEYFKNDKVLGYGVS